MTAPTILVPAFSRAGALSRLLNSLNDAEYTAEAVRLVISIDGGGSADVARIANEFKFKAGPVSTIQRKSNLGLRDHILWCGDQTELYGSVIVLEDDLVVDPQFYSYTVAGLAAFHNEESVAGIALYAPRYNEFARLPFEPCWNGSSGYFMQVPCSWGQAWSTYQWSKFRSWMARHDTKSDGSCVHIPPGVRAWPSSSWKKSFAVYLALLNRFIAYPYQAYSTNCSDAGGTHLVDGTNLYQVPFAHPKRGADRWQFGGASTTRYDPYMEPESLCIETLLGLPEGVLAVDLYGGKDPDLLRSKPLCLTTRRARQSLRSFGLEFRPIEMNLRHTNSGRAPCIVLANTSDVDMTSKPDRAMLYEYFSYFPLLSWDFASTVIPAFARRLRRKLLHLN